MRILRADPLNDVSFAALKEMYTSAERWDELQALYRKRIADTVDGEDKLDLLLQLCFLFEEILDRPGRRSRRTNKCCSCARARRRRRTLESLYERTERWRDLCRAVARQPRSRRRPRAHRPDVPPRRAVRDAAGEPGWAVDQYEGVLHDQPHHLRTQQALSRLIATEPSASAWRRSSSRCTRARARITIWRACWRSSSKTAQGRRKRRRACCCGSASCTSTARATSMRRSRPMRARSKPTRPRARADWRSRACRARARRSAPGARGVLQRALDRLKDAPLLQAELLLELAVLLDEYLGDKDGAERAYERLIELDPDQRRRGADRGRALEAIHLAQAGPRACWRSICGARSSRDRSPTLRGPAAWCGSRTCPRTPSGCLDAAIEAHKQARARSGRCRCAASRSSACTSAPNATRTSCECCAPTSDVSTDDRSGARSAPRRQLARGAPAGPCAARSPPTTTCCRARARSPTLRALASLYERASAIPTARDARGEEALIDDPPRSAPRSSSAWPS